MTEIEHARTMVARCEAKRDAAGDAQSRYYFVLCLAGWRGHEKRLSMDAENTGEARDTQNNTNNGEDKEY